MKACMIIAHPDDDAVFGVNFEKTFNFDWDIVTCSATLERLDGKEIIIKKYAPVYDTVTLQEAEANK